MSSFATTAAVGEIHAGLRGSLKGTGNSAAPSTSTREGSPNRIFSKMHLDSPQKAVKDWANGMWSSMPHFNLPASTESHSQQRVSPPTGPRNGRSVTLLASERDVRVESNGPITSSVTGMGSVAMPAPLGKEGEVAALRRKLFDLLEVERFEDAAVVRDQIRSLGDKGALVHCVDGQGAASLSKDAAPLLLRQHSDPPQPPRSAKAAGLPPILVKGFNRTQSAVVTFEPGRHFDGVEKGTSPVSLSARGHGPCKLNLAGVGSPQQQQGQKSCPMSSRGYIERDHVRTASVPLPRVINAIDYHPPSSVCSIM